MKYQVTIKILRLLHILWRRWPAIYTNLTAIKGPIYGSDYCPFENLGYVVVGLYDEGQCNNPHYHRSDDLPSDLDMDYVTSVTKLIVATILKEARTETS